MNEVMVKQPQCGALALNVGVNTLEAAMSLGTEIAKSGVFGEISSSQGMVSLVTMRDEGISMAEFKRRYRWIGTELSRVPNSLLGDFKRSGGKYDIIQADDETCEMEFTAPGGKPYRMKVTMEKMLKTGVPYAKDGKTLKKNWRDFPDDMLFARCCAKALRRIAPELMGGVYTAEEAQDFVSQNDAATTATPMQMDDVKSRICKMREADVEKKVERVVEAVEAEIVDEQNVDANDPNVCPVVGKLFGKPWHEFDTERLGKLLAKSEKFPELTAAHVAAINEVIERREAEIAQEAQEAEA